MSFSKLPCGQSGPHVGKTITHKRKREPEKAQSSEDLESGERPIKRPAVSIGDLRVLSILGQGAFGKVVLASLPGENQTVAIKCIPKKEVTTSLLRESRILQQVRGSPFICHAYAGLQSESHAYFVMEHLPGGSLGSLIEQRECLPDHLVEFYTAELVCGIQFLHERGIAHRSTSPGLPPASSSRPVPSPQLRGPGIPSVGQISIYCACLRPAGDRAHVVWSVLRRPWSTVPA
ncbi:putative protein kinase C delta type homolog isoform X5 [Hyperolius riggenbachi]|uniref:putative protein kinase C delta type homolog isoform X5 n=1 Tax=Hyperolius riggenbachi TaxID=752182 RepID=UPI0035A3296D